MTPYNDRLEINKLTNSELETAEKFVFYSVNQSTITIGRDSKCDISFIGDKSFSRIQTTIFFDKDLNIWRIKDGTNNNPSTNGTW